MLASQKSQCYNALAIVVNGNSSKAEQLTRIAPMSAKMPGALVRVAPTRRYVISMANASKRTPINRADGRVITKSIVAVA